MFLMQCDENNDTLHQHSVFFSVLNGSKNSRDLNIMSRVNQLPEYLESGEQARLIPVGKGTQRENRATSVLLAGMSIIHPLSKTLLGEIGQTVGSRSKLECYSQVVFKNEPGKGKFRPVLPGTRKPVICAFI